jgi:hypothetical protein
MKLLPTRFSLRTLLALVTLVALWMAAIPPCRRGKIDVIKFNVARNSKMMQSTKLILPFVFRCSEYRIDNQGPLTDLNGKPYVIPGFDLKQDTHRTIEYTFYIWWFGSVRMLPFSLDGESEVRDLKTRRWTAE